MKYSLEDMYSVNNDVTIITGAAGGIGGEVAKAFVSLGSKLALVDISEKGLLKMKESLSTFETEIKIFPTDITDENSVIDTVNSIKEHFGRINNLINCAGISHLEPATEFSVSAWDKVMDVNLKGTFMMCQKVGKVMLETDIKKRIVNFSSVRGLQGRIGDMAYSPSKGAINMLTKSLAIEWAKEDICVNAVAPTFAKTNINSGILEDDEKRKWVLDRIPKGRLTELEEIASTVLFFCAPCSRFITGQILYIDGGWTAA